MGSMWILIVVLSGSGGPNAASDTRLEVVKFATEDLCEDALKQLLTMRSLFRLGAICTQSK